MQRARLITLGVALATAAVPLYAANFHAATENATSPEPVLTRELIAVYLGSRGTDERSGMATAVPEMNLTLRMQAGAMGRPFIARGVSLEPLAQDGMRHLALLGSFDEVSVGGNWTNSTVIRYLGANIGRSTPIPQVVLLEREVRTTDSTIQVAPEREIARYIGVGQIGDWVKLGAPLPK